MFDGELLSERARLTPDRTALVSVETGERLTYAALDSRAIRAASALRSRGIAAGERFGILAHNSIDYLALFFGAMKCGAIAVPLSTRATPHELSGIVADCGMKIAFCDDDFTLSDCPVVPLPSINEPAARDTRQPPTDNPEAVACLLYTSGTTGKPKGVMIPRRQLFWNGYNTAICWGLREDDVSPVFTPLYHAGGLAAFLIPIFSAGGTIVLHKRFDAGEVWRTIERERCTVVLGVPTIWKMLLDAPEFASAKLDHVRWFISGGAPLPAYLIDAYAKRGIVLRQGYGMTEVGVNCFSMTSEEAKKKAGSIGKPMMFTAIRIVDPHGREVSDGQIGEMQIRGPHVSLGYWSNEQATAECYGKDGWLRTGDLARRDQDGFFFIAGRRKEMFITGGVNVYPVEVESALLAHPEVSDAALVAVPDDTWGEVGVAFVVSRVRQEELQSFLAERIAKYKIPKKFVFLDSLPRTPYGKVEKAKLRQQLSRQS